MAGGAPHHFAVFADANPANGRLGPLVGWNDDEVAPGAGFVDDPELTMTAELNSF